MNNLMFVKKLKYVGNNYNLLNVSKLWNFISLIRDVKSNEIRYVLKPKLKYEPNINKFFNISAYVVDENCLINDFIGIDKDGEEIKIVKNVESFEELIHCLSVKELNILLSNIKSEEKNNSELNSSLSKEQIDNLNKLDLNKLVAETITEIDDNLKLGSSFNI